jgi:hypothetical protein
MRGSPKERPSESPHLKVMVPMYRTGKQPHQHHPAKPHRLAAGNRRRSTKFCLKN